MMTSYLFYQKTNKELSNFLYNKKQALAIQLCIKKNMTDELFKENQLNLLQQVVNKLDELLVKMHDNENRAAKNEKEYWDWISQEELIKKMGITARTASTWRDAGILGATVVGRKIYFSKKAIQDMLWKKFKTRIEL